MLLSKFWLPIFGLLASGETNFDAVTPSSVFTDTHVQVDPISSSVYLPNWFRRPPALGRLCLKSGPLQWWTKWIAGVIACSWLERELSLLLDGQLPHGRTLLQKLNRSWGEKLPCSNGQNKRNLRLASGSPVRSTVDVGREVCVRVVFLAVVPPILLLVAARSASRRLAKAKQAATAKMAIATVTSLSGGQASPASPLHHEHRDESHMHGLEMHIPTLEEESCKVHQVSAECSEGLRTSVMPMPASPERSQFHRSDSQEFDDKDVGGCVAPSQTDDCEFNGIHTTEGVEAQNPGVVDKHMHTQSLDCQDLMRDLNEMDAEACDHSAMLADQWQTEGFNRLTSFEVETGCCALYRLYSDEEVLEGDSDRSQCGDQQLESTDAAKSGQEAVQSRASMSNRIRASSLDEGAIAQHQNSLAGCEVHQIYSDSSESETSRIEPAGEIQSTEDLGVAGQRPRATRPRHGNSLQCRQRSEPHRLQRPLRAHKQGDDANDSHADMPHGEQSPTDAAWALGTQGYVRGRVEELESSFVGVVGPELAVGDSFDRAVTLPPFSASKKTFGF